MGLPRLTADPVKALRAALALRPGSERVKLGCPLRRKLFFEERLPGDGRPRKAIEAARAFARGKIGVGAARQAAVAAHAAGAVCY